MRRSVFWLSAAGVAGVIGGALAWSRRASAATDNLPPLPSEGVSGDMTSNWGTTPTDLRPLFLQMENLSTIAGSARVFAIIAARESAFVTTAHNGNAEGEQDERDSSALAYKNNKDRNPPLKYGDDAAAFGSGGLFGQLAPYFLWTGVPEVGAKAPLLSSPPTAVYEPALAAFGAVVYLQRIVQHYRTDDIADVKAGWANPQLLGSARGSPRYNETRNRFVGDAEKLGISLAELPKKLVVTKWPGVLAVYKSLTGK